MTAEYPILDGPLPGGVRCPGCGRLLHDGDPYAERPLGVGTEDDEPVEVVAVTCVYCEEV